jgi:hypothetical protein
MMPVPDKATVNVPAPLPAFTFKAAAFAPTVVGRNTTLIVQLAFAGTVAPQVVVCEN